MTGVGPVDARSSPDRQGENLRRSPRERPEPRCRRGPARPAAATARLVAGGEDGSQVRRPERPRLPPAAIAGPTGRPGPARRRPPSGTLRATGSRSGNDPSRAALAADAWMMLAAEWSSPSASTEKSPAAARRGWARSAETQALGGILTGCPRGPWTGVTATSAAAEKFPSTVGPAVRRMLQVRRGAEFVDVAGALVDQGLPDIGDRGTSTSPPGNRKTKLRGPDGTAL